MQFRLRFHNMSNDLWNGKLNTGESIPSNNLTKLNQFLELVVTVSKRGPGIKLPPFVEQVVVKVKIDGW